MTSIFQRTTPRLAAFGALIAIALTAASACAKSSDLTQPSWMTIDAGAKKVTMDIEAGWNGNNGALNFNGYHDGDATVVVPVGWSVVVNFKNNDANLPHSLLVTKPYAKGEFPQTAGHSEVAIPRAYTRDPVDGISAGQTDDFRFTAKEAKDYYYLCGVTGHAMSGMWIHLSLRDNVDQPGLIAEEGASGRE